MIESGRLPETEGGRKSITIEASKTIQNYLASLNVFLEASVPEYSVQEQKDLLRQAAKLGIVPDEIARECDEKYSEDYICSIESVLAQHARFINPYIVDVEKEREYRFDELFKPFTQAEQEKNQQKRIFLWIFARLRIKYILAREKVEGAFLRLLGYQMTKDE